MPEHFLFEDRSPEWTGRLGAMGVESVAADLGRLDRRVVGWRSGRPPEALASYERIRPLDSGEARLIAVFEATTALLIGERWVRWHSVEESPL